MIHTPTVTMGWTTEGGGCGGRGGCGGDGYVCHIRKHTGGARFRVHVPRAITALQTSVAIGSRQFLFRDDVGQLSGGLRHEIRLAEQQRRRYVGLCDVVAQTASIYKDLRFEVVRTVHAVDLAHQL